MKKFIYVGYMHTKQHEKHLLLGARGLWQDSQMLLLHFNQLSFLLNGITGNDDHTNNKFKQLQQELNKSGAELEQEKPTEKENFDRNCFYIVHAP